MLSPGGQAELCALGLPTEGADWRFESFAMIGNRWPNGRATADPLPRGLAYWQLDRGKLDRALFAFAGAAGAADPRRPTGARAPARSIRRGLRRDDTR